MKNFCLALAAMILTSNFANAAMTEVSPREVEDYKTVVIAAFDRGAFTCDIEKPEEAINQAKRVYVDDSGPQPALLLTYQIDGGQRVGIYITTNASYQSILDLEVKLEKIKRVNHGTLVKPNIRNEWKPTDTSFCARKVSY